MARRTPSQERGRRTQEAVIIGASEVFERGSYEGATTDQIAEASQVSQGAIYFHFKSKERIALAVIQEQHDRMYALVDKALADETDPLLQLIRASRAISQLLKDDIVVRAGTNLALGPGALRAASAASYEIWITGVTSLLQRAKEAGTLTTSQPVERLGVTLIGTFTGVQLMAQTVTDRTDLLGRVADMWQVFIDGCVEEGKKAIYHRAVEALFRTL